MARSRGGVVGRVVATVTGNVFLVFGSLFFALVTIVANPIRREWSQAAIRLWATGVLWASGVRVVVRRPPEVDPRASYVFLANHQSLFDIPALLHGLPETFRMVAKESLFRIPFFGWAMTAAGFVSVDRADGASARQSLAVAERQLRSGGSILVFPEGTRGGFGRLLPFKRGGFLLALRTGLPIVPVGIRGTGAVQPPKSFAIQPGVVEIRFGQPIAAAEYGVRRKRELIAEVRRRLAELAAVSAGEVAEIA